MSYPTKEKAFKPPERTWRSESLGKRSLRGVPYAPAHLMWLITMSPKHSFIHTFIIINLFFFASIGVVLITVHLEGFHLLIWELGCHSLGSRSGIRTVLMDEPSQTWWGEVRRKTCDGEQLFVSGTVQCMHIMYCYKIRRLYCPYCIWTDVNTLVVVSFLRRAQGFFWQTSVRNGSSLSHCGITPYLLFPNNALNAFASLLLRALHSYQKSGQRRRGRAVW